MTDARALIWITELSWNTNSMKVWQGLEEAFEETKGEGDTDIELVKLLLKHKIGIDIIVQYTDLPVKQIEDLKRGIAAASLFFW